MMYLSLHDAKWWDRCLSILLAIVLIFAIAYPVNLHGSQPNSITHEPHSNQTVADSEGDQGLPPGDSVVDSQEGNISLLQKQMHLHKQLEQSHTREQYLEQHRNNSN